MKINVVMHKNIDISNLKLDSSYAKLLVGSKYEQSKGIQMDCAGENISHKNTNFCELTGLYWMWKNDKSDITGLVHYRRFFKDNNNLYVNKILSKESICSYLSEYDVILPSKWIYKESLYNQYKDNHNIKDLDRCRDIIYDIYPDYIDSFDEIINSNSAYLYNMIICKKELLNQYCEWMFNILFRLEKNTDLTDYDDYQKRIYGFLSERLLNVWVHHNKFKIKELDIIKTDDKKIENFLRNVKLNIKKKIYINKR